VRYSVNTVDLLHTEVPIVRYSFTQLTYFIRRYSVNTIDLLHAEVWYRYLQ
jgi:hypothetical protein